MKRLIICADGTWGSPETKHPSNVVRLTRAIATYGFSSGTSNGQTKDEQIEQMVTVALGLAPLWENCLGKEWQSLMPRERVRELLLRM